MLYIKNGTIIDPEADRQYPADIWIKDEKIIKIEERKGQTASENTNDTEEVTGNPEFAEEKASCLKGVQEIDASGMFVAPGLADVHVHFRDPGFTYKEDIITGAAAAAAGGFTEIVLMANTRPCVDNEETLAYVLEKGKRTGIHIGSCVNVTKSMAGKELVDMEYLASKGAAGFTDDGIPLTDAELVRQAMQKAAELKKPISFHEEDPAFISNNGVNAGKASAFYGIGGSPREAEISLVERDVKLALETGADVVIQHISSKEAVELVRKAKAAGGHVYAEGTPHHFTLTEDAVIEKGTMAKMNPPLREESDRLAVIEGLKDGTIDMIATDHAPHSREEKAKDITQAPSGIIGLETALSLGIKELVQKGYLTIPQLLDRMSTAPCRLYGLDGGCVKEGKRASLVIFNPEETWKVETFASKSENSPFIGEELPGVVHYTICDGKIVYKRER